VLIRSDVYEEVKGLLEEPEEIDPSLYEFDEIETEDDAQPSRRNSRSLTAKLRLRLRQALCWSAHTRSFFRSLCR